MACFQVVGVSQKIDSTDWSTTIKGQIRVSVESEIDEYKLGLKKSDEDDIGHTGVGHKQQQQTKPEQPLPRPSTPEVSGLDPTYGDDLPDEIEDGDWKGDWDPESDWEEYYPPLKKWEEWMDPPVDRGKRPTPVSYTHLTLPPKA